ncbi:hypothetical protein M427DRAFT_51874 [Gonapodya prolifera JEL478]|uniref:F-box domain-containing protein n=1 Tax=Gonapodya prolifera (strain JEL478) TaxID=1344416 RepID=A0A139AW01_GONPJ|nr:hypothetical protein M427DRAFT_51874 [Gonapodya prolifera JEL478]|eukprot:KXS20921.1 hypothetical protein M427DRAFT_51874 [Gonapodya prolifera JEL478]
MESLPAEILQKIFHLTSPRCFFGDLPRVCRQWNAVVRLQESISIAVSTILTTSKRHGELDITISVELLPRFHVVGGKLVSGVAQLRCMENVFYGEIFDPTALNERTRVLVAKTMGTSVSIIHVAVTLPGYNNDRPGDGERKVAKRMMTYTCHLQPLSVAGGSDLLLESWKTSNLSPLNSVLNLRSKDRSPNYNGWSVCSQGASAMFPRVSSIDVYCDWSDDIFRKALSRSGADWGSRVQRFTFHTLGHSAPRAVLPTVLPSVHTSLVDLGVIPLSWGDTDIQSLRLPLSFRVHRSVRRLRMCAISTGKPPRNCVKDLLHTVARAFPHVEELFVEIFKPNGDLRGPRPSFPWSLSENILGESQEELSAGSPDAGFVWGDILVNTVNFHTCRVEEGGDWDPFTEIFAHQLKDALVRGAKRVTVCRAAVGGKSDIDTLFGKIF